ncbi:caspase family protein [Micromonospora sp. NPDC049044]|uniref:caspase family protein n=1 Tax=unclassified Micromonospora TaxID=2617518 RepID=UPI0033F2D4FF
MTLADPLRSRVVIVGVSAYPAMPADRQLPTVRDNVDDLAARLRDPGVWGIPESRITALKEPHRADAVIDALRAARADAAEALIFYYAGHGLTDPLVGGQLYLALRDVYEPAGTHLALQFEHVRREFLLSTAPRKLVILDCCWSGLATRGAMGENVAAATVIRGSAVLTASAANRTALAPPGEKHTAFTGALLRILADGIAGEPELLTTMALYRQLHADLKAVSRPLPELNAGGTGADIPWVRNAGFVRPKPGDRPGVVEDGPGSPPPFAASDAMERMLLLVRQSRYDEVHQLGRQAAELGEDRALDWLVLQLRRTGRYEEAAAVERARQK